MIKKAKILKLESKRPCLANGMKGQIDKAKINEIAGEIAIRDLFAVSVTISAFENNLMASLKGWKIPRNPTLFGPFRIWI